MQQQMSAGMGAPADPAKAFKTEAEALGVTRHTWELAGVEKEVVAALRSRR